MIEKATSREMPVEQRELDEIVRRIVQVANPERIPALWLDRASCCQPE
ncbi:MAG: hypothetical protein M3412_02005 [Chloroflexota bacterium]|nr:hypothetical protein [Chloroflexota bacterium]